MLNKNILYIIVLSLSLLLTGCKNSDDSISSNTEVETLIEDELSQEELNKVNNYKISISLDQRNKSYTAKQSTTFVNDTGRDLREIYFRLYPNAFDEGYIDLDEVKINNRDSKYEIEGASGTVLKIELEQILLKGEEISVDLKYFVKLPLMEERFGYNKDTMNLGNWYPVLSVYDKDGWSREPYYEFGDPFYTDISNYDVDISVEKEWVVASSGNILSENIKGDIKTYKIEAKLIRDFAFVASSDFKIREEIADDTLIKIYYKRNDKDLVEESLKYSRDSLRLFNSVFGKYPYGTYSVVFTEFSTGMEYPGISFIGEQYFEKSKKNVLEQLIVHETAHQWWYGLVGNNQVRESWLDEGLTSYSEIIYMREMYGEDVGDAYFREEYKDTYDEYNKYYIGEDDIVNKPLNKFRNGSDYEFLVYIKSVMILKSIEEQYEREVFLKVLQTFFNDNKYKNATSDDFSKAFTKVTGDSFEDVSNKYK